MNSNEFKERMQFLLAEALNPPKKQQCLIEFNRLCVQNKTEPFLKVILQTMEMSKMNEITLRALKISIQVYKYDAAMSLRTAQILNKSFSEGIEIGYQICGECYRLLATPETISPLCELLCPLALRLNSQPVQIGATIALKYVLQFDVPLPIKKQIQSAFVKNTIIVHPTLVEIMIQITANQDQNIVQVQQRSLAGLQEQKHTYQIKQSLCKLLFTIATFTIYNEHQLLQCITILRETSLNKIISLQQAAKQALQCYQNLYIAQNQPAVTSSSYFSDIKPFIKKKRGDNHLVLDAEKYKKLQISQLKQQIGKIQAKESEEKIQDALIDQFIQQEQINNDNDREPEDNPKLIYEDLQENLQDTQLFEDPTPALEETQDFREIEDSPQKALELASNNQVEEAFLVALNKGDDLLLLRLMMTVENYFGQLSKSTASQLISKFNTIYKTNFIEVLFKDFATEALQTPNRDVLKINQLNQLQKFL